MNRIEFPISRHHYQLRHINLVSTISLSLSHSLTLAIHIHLTSLFLILYRRII